MSEPGRAALTRWIASNLATMTPQAMAPIAFGLATLGVTDDIDLGAALVTAMLAAQIVGAVPVTQLSARLGIRPGLLIRLLIGFRSLMLALLVLALVAGAPVPLLLVTAALTGLVMGSALGLLRAVVNDLVDPARLPRVLGLLATVNELVFVAGPVVASALGAVSVPATLVLMVLACAAPILLLPRLDASPRDVEESTAGPAARVTRGVRVRFVLWLVAAGCGAGVAAGVEIGAVSLALAYALEPTQALVFTVPLCVASMAGGLVVSVRNRTPRIRTVVLMLVTTASGAVLVVGTDSVVVAMAGTVLAGVCLAPLATFYSLTLDDLLPWQRRAEGFALLRTSQAAGMVAAGLLLTITSPRVTLLATGSATLVAGVAVVLLLGRPVVRRHLPVPVRRGL